MTVNSHTKAPDGEVGEQRNKDQSLRGTGEQRTYWGTVIYNVSKQILDFSGTGEQFNSFQGKKGTGIPWEGP